MTREQATKEAREIADEDGVLMCVTYNVYSEEPDREERYGYHPAAAQHIFMYETVLETIEPEGETR